MEIPSVLMRGGTSRGLFFLDQDLPEDPSVRDSFILAAYGSPDQNRKQVDGVGGATSSTSKVAIISKSQENPNEILYEFGQVGIDKPIIDRRGNCGNISAAVGPFAVDQGLVQATEPVTKVLFTNVNTHKSVVAHVPTSGDRFDPLGDFTLPGVAGTGSRIKLEYLHPGGAVTGHLLPTGNAIDTIEVAGLGAIEVSIVDSANPLVFVRWRDFGLTGHETAPDVDGNAELLRSIEELRSKAGVLAGIGDTPEQVTNETPSVPKFCFVGAPMDYTTAAGDAIRATDMNLRAATMSMGRLHPSYPLTGGIATTTAAFIPGTVVNQEIVVSQDNESLVRIGHQAGVIELEADITVSENDIDVKSVSSFRTARRLMAGTVEVPDTRVYSTEK
jgi:2-methylaconitate cis-trans-isomerase PrpF